MGVTESPKLGVFRDDNLVIVRDLTVEEYSAYRNARDRIMRFTSDYDMLIIVVMNYLDFQEYMKAAPEMPPHDLQTAFKAEVNRRILNLLASVRSYLDHSETKLKRRYGEDSEPLRRFKSECSFAYDNFFSYRFLYELRNYVQHCGMPVGHISMSSRLLDLAAKTVETIVSISFDRDSLLENHRKWKPALRQELSEHPVHIPIAPLLDELVNCLRQINGTVIEGELSELEQCAAAIHSLTECVEGEGQPIIINMRNTLDGSIIATPDDFTNAQTNLTLEFENVPILRVDAVKKMVHVTY